jgi:hypothetical protein
MIRPNYHYRAHRLTHLSRLKFLPFHRNHHHRHRLN